MQLLLVQAFVNTLDLETGSDLLRDRESARRWLGQTRLIRSGTRVTDADLQTARQVRESLRALMSHNGGGQTPTSAKLRPLRELAGDRQPRVNIERDGRVELSAEPRSDLRGGLLGLLLTVRDAQADGTWSRLKICANSDCQWAFYDASRNRRGTWCEMSVCGNRLKNRRFRARRKK
jgi:predicted RNA-binding Zn ribbon-like protein